MFILTEKLIKFEDVFSRFPEDVQNQIATCPLDSCTNPKFFLKDHMKLVFEAARKKNNPTLMTAAIFHDLGKINTQDQYFNPKTNDYVPVFIGHENYCTMYIKKYIKLFRDLIPTDGTVFDVGFICHHHVKARLYAEGKIPLDKEYDKLKERKKFKYLMEFVELNKQGYLTNN